MKVLPASLLRIGDRIECPGDGRVEKVTNVTKSRAFVAVRTDRHDHIVRPGNHTVEFKVVSA